MRQNQLDQIRNLQLQIAAMEQEIEHLYAVLLRRNAGEYVVQFWRCSAPCSW